MRYRVNAIFALQTPHGLAYGCTREMEGDRMTFQVAGVLGIGDVAEWRMQLVGRGEAITGTLKVEGRQPAPPGETPIYEGRVLTLSPEQRKRLDAWLSDRSGSGSREPRRPYAAASPPKPSATAAVAPRPAPDGRPAEKRPAGGRDAINTAIKLTIERVKRVPPPKQRPLHGGVELPDDDHLGDPAVSRPTPLPRVRDEIRTPTEAPRPMSEPRVARLAPQATPVATRPGSTVPPPPRSVPPTPPEPEARDIAGPQNPARRPPIPRSAAQAPHRSIADEPLPASVEPPGSRVSTLLAAPTSVDPPLPAADPTVAIRPGTDPLHVRLAWSNGQAYSRDYARYLKGDGIFLPLVDPPTLRVRGCRVYVRLILPSGAQLVCGGEVVAPMSQGVGVALQLTADQRVTLSSELKSG